LGLVHLGHKLGLVTYFGDHLLIRANRGLPTKQGPVELGFRQGHFRLLPALSHLLETPRHFLVVLVEHACSHSVVVQPTAGFLCWLE
jgi:hypothetical protein